MDLIKTHQRGFREISFHSFTLSLTHCLSGSLTVSRNSQNSAKHHIKHRFEQGFFFLTFHYEKFCSCPFGVNPALSPRKPLFCFLYTGLFIEIKSHNMWSFVSGLFHHPCCSMCHWFILIYCQVVFHCIDVLRFVLPLTSSQIFGSFVVFGYYVYCYCEHSVQVFVWICFHCS